MSGWEFVAPAPELQEEQKEPFTLPYLKVELTYTDDGQAAHAARKRQAADAADRKAKRLRDERRAKEKAVLAAARASGALGEEEEDEEEGQVVGRGKPKRKKRRIGRADVRKVLQSPPSRQRQIALDKAQAARQAAWEQKHIPPHHPSSTSGR